MCAYVPACNCMCVHLLTAVHEAAACSQRSILHNTLTAHLQGSRGRDCLKESAPAYTRHAHASISARGYKQTRVHGSAGTFCVSVGAKPMTQVLRSVREYATVQCLPTTLQGRSMLPLTLSTACRADGSKEGGSRGIRLQGMGSRAWQ